jgi:hypothetical protein
MLDLNQSAYGLKEIISLLSCDESLFFGLGKRLQTSIVPNKNVTRSDHLTKALRWCSHYMKCCKEISVNSGWLIMPKTFFWNWVDACGQSIQSFFAGRVNLSRNEDNVTSFDMNLHPSLSVDRLESYDLAFWSQMPFFGSELSFPQTIE